LDLKMLDVVDIDTVRGHLFSLVIAIDLAVVLDRILHEK
jgi:hypothetical protein